MSSLHHFSPSHESSLASPTLPQIFAPENLSVHQPTENPVLRDQDKDISVVEVNFEEQKTLNKLKKHVTVVQAQSIFLEDFQDDSALLRYKAHEYEEESLEEEELEVSCPYSTSSTLPTYLMMSRFERINYFARLNWEYEMKMKPVKLNSNLNSNSDVIHSKPKRKPAIKFSDVVYELPFAKDDEPKNLSIELEVQTQIIFDLAAYEMDEEEQEEDQISQQSDEELNKEQNYLNEADEFDFEENMKSEIFSTTEKPYTEEVEEPSKEDTENFPLNHEPSFSQSRKIQQNIHMEELSFEEEEEELNVFKRDANRNFLSEASTSSDSNSSDSSGSDLREIDYNDELESYLALFLNGRKINPNALQVESREEQ